MISQRVDGTGGGKWPEGILQRDAGHPTSVQVRTTPLRRHAQEQTGRPDEQHIWIRLPHQIIW